MTTEEQAKLDRLKMPDIGDMLDGRYRIQSVVATGGMGVILRAEQLPMERAVAIKLLHPHVAAGNPKIVGRFEQEVALAKLLNHRNTIRLYDFGETREGLVYVAMEYLDGVDLKRLIEQEGALPLDRAVDICLQMLDGLAEAHAQDFIHRDLKPSNVFITHNRRGEDLVKLLDFGIAKSLAGSDVDLTGSGAICGTPGYVSPEYLRNEPLEKASDVYAVGLILLEMLIGQRVFMGDAPVQTMMMHLQLDPDIPAEIAQTPLAEIIRKATCKQPAERYADADQMLHALEAIAEELPAELRLDDYQFPSAQIGTLAEADKAKEALAEESSGSSFDENSNASIPEAEHTPVEMDAKSSGMHSLRPPPIPGSRAKSEDTATQDRVEPDPVEPDAVEQESAEPDPAEPDQAEQDWTGQDPVAQQWAAAGELDDASHDWPTDFGAVGGVDRRRRWMIGAGAAALVALVLLGLALSDPGEPAEAAAGQASSDEASATDEAAQAGAQGGSEADKLAAVEADAGQADAAEERLRFDLDTDPSGATVRLGDKTLGTTPLVYRVRPDELPQKLVFERDGFVDEEAELTVDGSPIIVAVLDKDPGEAADEERAHEAHRSAHKSSKQTARGSRSHRGRRSSHKDRAGEDSKKKISDKKVEQVLDEFLVE